MLAFCFLCSLICDKSYSSEKSLNQHINIHYESKAFKCDVCWKVFYIKFRLIQYYRTHAGEKPFAYQVWNRKFIQKSHLVQHQATHSEVKSFKCSICPENRSFKTKAGLTNQIAFHYEPKFACRHCDYKSYTTSDLKKHKKLHDKNKD